MAFSSALVAGCPAPAWKGRFATAPPDEPWLREAWADELRNLTGYRPGAESRRSLVQRAGRPWYQPPTWKWRPSTSLTNQQPSPTPYPPVPAAAAGGTFVKASAP